MPKSSEEELEQFVAPLPAWLQMVLRQDFSSFPQDKISDWNSYDFDELQKLKSEYERILQKIPREWKKYRKRAMLASLMFPIPKAKPGRPRDSRAEDYASLHPSESYRTMAKKEVEGEPEGEAKKLLIQKERERIRQSVIRSRRRKKT